MHTDFQAIQGTAQQQPHVEVPLLRWCGTTMPVYFRES
jgi:hypothetical protein